MTWKTGAVIVAYAILLSALSVIGLLVLRNSSVAQQAAEYSDGSGVYVLTRQEWLQILNGESLNVDSSRIVGRNVFDTYYAEKSFAWLPVTAVSLCLFFLTSSLLLWLVLQGIQKRESLRLLRSLKALDSSDETLSAFEPELQGALQEIGQKFEDNLNDYKRLNSYVSHEQKNTLSVLRTKMELKQDTAAVELIDRISSSMEDILTLSDDAGSASTAPVDVALICASACDAYRTISDQITFDFGEENMIILAKERWVYRAVNSLLDNAVKYGEGKPIQVQVRNQNHSVIVTVQDHGIGIPAEKQEQIFGNRYRINELKKDGYGIGLSLVAHVCNLCSGFAYVESKEKEGSCFYLSFPELTEVN